LFGCKSEGLDDWLLFGCKSEGLDDWLWVETAVGVGTISWLQIGKVG